MAVNSPEIELFAAELHLRKCVCNARVIIWKLQKLKKLHIADIGRNRWTEHVVIDSSDFQLEDQMHSHNVLSVDSWKHCAMSPMIVLFVTFLGLVKKWTANAAQQRAKSHRTKRLGLVQIVGGSEDNSLNDRSLEHENARQHFATSSARVIRSQKSQIASVVPHVWNKLDLIVRCAEFP